MSTESIHRKTDLFKSTVIIGFGYIIPTIINLLLLPLYTLELSNEEYGLYDLLLVLVSLVVPVVIMRLDAGIFRFLIAARDDQEETKRIISSVIFVVIGIPIIVFGALLVPIWKSDFIVKIGIILYIYLSASYATVGYTTRGLGRNDIYTKMVCIQYVLIAFFSLIFVYICKMHLAGVLIAMNVAIIVSILYACIAIRLGQYISLAFFSKKILKEILSYSLPMVPNNIAMWVVNTSDRLIITGILGLAANGIYAIANKFPAYMSQVTGVFNMSWQENASMYVDDKDAGQYFSEITDNFLNFIFSLAAILLGATPFMLKTFVKTDYTEAYHQVPILVGGVLFSCVTSHYGSIFLALKRTKIIGFTSVVGAIINLVINLLLIKKIGLYAASVSTMISFGIIMVVRVEVLKKYILVVLNRTKMIVGSLMLVGLAFMYYRRLWWLNCVTMIIACIYASLLNRKMLKAIVLKCREKIGR